MGCFYFTRWYVEEGEEREGKGKGGKKGKTRHHKQR